MSQRVLESVFRRPLQFLLLLLMLPPLGVAVAYIVFPRTYPATATLWAFHRYEVIGLSGPETDPNSTPAETQATALTELLQTRVFALSIAKATDLPSTLSVATQANSQLQDNALFTEISQHVAVAADGYNLFVITYINTNAVIAQQVVQSTIQNFAVESEGFTSVEAKILLEGDQTQLVNAKNVAAQAVAAEANYIAAHSNLTQSELLTDPQYTLLHAQSQQAQATVANIQASIDTINQEINAQGNSSANLFKVLDAPAIPYVPVSRTKDYLTGGGVGLGVALLAFILYVIISSRRDRTIHSPLDLQQIIALPIVMQIPQLNDTSVSLLVESAQQGSA
ncbi:MAG: hypothetical protein ABI406_15930 [Ktedonobacteraceae bacterium]